MAGASRWAEQRTTVSSEVSVFAVKQHYKHVFNTVLTTFAGVIKLRFVRYWLMLQMLKIGRLLN